MTSPGVALDVSLVVTESTVRLVGGGVDVSAAHGGVRPGLVNALHDVRSERTREGDLASRPRGDTTVKDLAVEARPGLVSLRRAGELLAESQALTINEQLGDQANIATSLSQLANLRAASGDTTAAIHLHIRALSIRLALGVPRATNNITQLTQLRDRTDATVFAETVQQVLDHTSYTNLIALLESHTTDE